MARREIICGIYKITNLVNNKLYIGQSKDLYERLRKHKESLKNNYHFNKHLQRSYNKYGKDNFDFEIIEVCSYELLNDKETFYIDKYNTMNSNYGYNKESGGKVKTVSAETKRKQSLMRTGTKASEETKRKMSLSRMGENNGFYNNKHSKETKIKIGASRKGVPLSPERKEKAIKYLLSLGKQFKEGENHTNSKRVYKLDSENFNIMCVYESIRIAEKVEFNKINGVVRNHLKSKTMERNNYWISVEDYLINQDFLDTYFKGSNNYNRKEVFQLDLNNVFIKKWNTLREASLSFTNKIISSIGSCVQGKNKTAYGFKWMYKEEFDKIINNT